MTLAEHTPPAIVSLISRAVGQQRLVDLVVTNVPGPVFPLYLLGSEMLAIYPQVPLMQNVGLGIALISYNGQVCWGFNADPSLVPDLRDFVGLIRSSFERLATTAEVELSQPRARLDAG